jgi:phosphoribosylformylglycinamidine cyclo-ligase
MTEQRPPGLTYRDAGVDIDAQEDALARIKAAVQATRTPGVLADLGAFGGLFRPDLQGMQEPVLVASADGVGTKLEVAHAAGVHDTVGRDLVNHCVNDILVQGARPLFFLDYVATGRLDPAVLAAVVQGVARGCRENGCALLGGETAEMPGFYRVGQYDVAGFIVGIVDRPKVLDGSAVRPGDVLVGLPSAGLHTNGYSLARKLFFEVAGLTVHDRVEPLGCTVGEALLAEHRSYLPVLRGALDETLVSALAHVTGGGLTDNVPRVLPEGTAAQIDPGAWPLPPLFRWMQETGRIEDHEMRRTFNLGIGMVALVPEGRLDAFEHHLDVLHEPHWRIGRVVPGERRVVYA